MAAVAIHCKWSPLVLEVEAPVVLEGVSFAREMGFLEVMEEMDSSVVAGL